MLLNFILILLGLAGSLILVFGPGYNWYYSVDKAPVYLPQPDLIIEVPDISLGEPIWSSFSLEVLRLSVFLVCFLTLMALIGEWGEKRVLAFLVMVEVLLVSLAVLMVLNGSSAGFNISAHYNAALCVLAAGGADTALALALFMTFYKASGETTLK